MNAFFSTPWFIKDLTDLSIEVVGNADKEIFLKEGLQNMNEHLPSAVYLPFVNSNIIPLAYVYQILTL